MMSHCVARIFKPLGGLWSVIRPAKVALGLLLSLCAIETSASVHVLVSAHPTEGVTNGADRISELYDVIFPRRTSSPEGLFLFRLSLRYLTTRGPGIQYEITKYDDGRVRVVSLICKRGVFSYLKLERPIADMSETDFEKLKESAKTIPVMREEFDLPAESFRELKDSFNALSFPKLTDDGNRIYFHGTGYDLLVQAGREQISYSVVAEPLGEENSSLPIVKWMNLAHKLLSSNAGPSKSE